MNTREILIAARALIADPKRWTKGAEARDANGRGVLATDPSACAFCAYGALCRKSDSVYKRSDALDALRGAAAGVQSIVDFNDAHWVTHDRVLEVFDRAIAAETL